jgi:peptide/nickel transport system substrate-binding protein
MRRNEAQLRRYKRAGFRYDSTMTSSAIRGRARLSRLAALALAALLLTGAAPPPAGTPTHGIATHGIATHGAPALPPDFDHFPYADPAAKKGGRLRVGLSGTFDSLNPFNVKSGTAAQGLVGNVYQTLMARSQDEPFTLYPLIAQSLEIDPARTRLTFHLDPRAHFSDGRPITAEDVLFTFDLLKSKGRPQQRGAYSLVKSITAPDAHTVTYDLSGIGDRELPLILAIMPVLPKHATDVERFADATLAKPLASGPYVVAEVDPGARLLLRRDPNYWGADVSSQRGFYNFDEIDLQYFRDGNSLFEAFKAGLVDYRDETSTTRWSSGYDFPALRDGRVVKEELRNDNPKGLEGFVFNTRRPFFQDVRLREALGMMFDFEWINANLYSGLYTRTKSFFDESTLSSSGRPASEKERALLAPWPGAVRADILDGKWRPPVNDGSGRDREMAKRALDLLAQAGYQLVDGKLSRDGQPLSFEIMVKDRSQERLALNYAGSLARIGVDVRVRLVDEVQYQRRRQKFDFDMMIGQYVASASPGNEQRMRWSSASATQESSFNLAGAASPAIDALIGALLAAQSDEDFVAAVRAYDRVLLSGFYVVPLYHASSQWTAHSAEILRPARVPRYGAPIYGPTLDSWWRKSP